MNRIIIHWTAGRNKATATDKKHYHFIVEGDGNVVNGDNPVSANAEIIKGKPYAAHTRACNTGSIGVSMAGMFGAKESPFQPGEHPITEKQFNATIKLVAKLCGEYNIPVRPNTVLTHAEVEGTLGIKQRGKWDITRLPFDARYRGAKAVGDHIRRRVASVMDVKTPKTTPPRQEQKAPPQTKPIPWWKRLFGFKGGSRIDMTR